MGLSLLCITEPMSLLLSCVYLDGCPIPCPVVIVTGRYQMTSKFALHH